MPIWRQKPRECIGKMPCLRLTLGKGKPITCSASKWPLQACGHPTKIAKHATRYTTTTSMTTPQQQEALFREGRLNLAINAYKQGQFQALQPATTTYNVPRTTTRHRIAGIAPKCGSAAPNRRLTPAQEESLKQWIFSMNQRGIPPRIATIQQMASLLATQHPRSQPVGEQWVYNFIKRHKDLQSKWNHKYNYQHTKCEDPVLI